jgi:hypothetical protein
VAERIRVDDLRIIRSRRLTCHRVGVGRGVIRISGDAIRDYLEETKATASAATVSPRLTRPRLKHLKL